MKCGSCRDTNANEYKKINPDNNLFDILKSLNANRTYNPKDSYFCDRCIGIATAKLARKVTLIGDQNANSFTINTTDSSTGNRDASNSSKDEYDEIVASKRVFSDKGTPLYIPLNRTKRSSETLPRTKPCPKRFKKAARLASVAEGSDLQESAVVQPNIVPGNSSDSEPLDLEEMIMSTPSLEEEPNKNTGSRSDRKSESLSNKGTSGVDTSVSDSPFNALDPNADFVEDPNVSANQSEDRESNSNNEEVSSLRVEESHAQSPRSSTEKSDVESDRSPTKKIRTEPRRTSTEKSRTQPRRSSTEKSRTQPRRTPTEKSRTQPRRSSTEKSDAESDRSTTEKSRTEPRRSSAEKSDAQPQRSPTEESRKRPHPSTSGKSRTEPQTTTRTVEYDSDTLSSHNSDGGTLAPAAKSPRIRQPISNIPKNIKDFFAQKKKVDDYERSFGG